MSLMKHDSTVVLEIIAALAVVSLLAIATSLFLIWGQMKDVPQVSASAPVASDKKIEITDLAPTLVQEINTSFGNIQAQGAYTQFVMSKVLEKNFSKEEIEAMPTEFAAIVKKMQEEQAAQAAQAPQGEAAPAAAPQK